MGKTAKAVTGDKNPGDKSLSPLLRKEGLVQRGAALSCPQRCFLQGELSVIVGDQRVPSDSWVW